MAKDGLRFLGLDDGSLVNYNCDILDKDDSIFNYVQYMFDRTNCMFSYDNLPDTIPAPMLEYMLQIYGSVAIISYNGEIYAMRANFGGPPDPYYRPTQAVIANPALGISEMYRIINHLPPFDRTTWEAMPKCVRFLNDSQIIGLLPMFARYATQLTENDISIRSAQINSRQQTIITAPSGPEIESAEKYVEKLVNGELSVILSRPFLEGVEVTNVSTGTSNIVMQLIELQQYLKASWYNEVGLNPNFNMKSQYISSDEINSYNDIMLPLVDNMLISRRQAVDAINKEFGTNISVDKNSAWWNKQEQLLVNGVADSDVTSADNDSPNPVLVDYNEGAETSGDVEDRDNNSSDVSSSTEEIDEKVEVIINENTSETIPEEDESTSPEDNDDTEKPEEQEENSGDDVSDVPDGDTQQLKVEVDINVTA